MEEKQTLEEKTKMVTSEKSKVPTASSIFLKATLLSILFAGAMLLITALGVLGYGYYKIDQFAKKSGTTVSDLKTLIETGLQKTPENINGYKTILLLGVDTVANKPNSPQLTDTILLLSLNVNTGKINTVSLPRDLWSTDYKTRINALYEYGKEKYPERPEQFTEEVVQDLTGLEINHTITLSLDTVAEIVDILGGIDVTVAEGFTDTEFPRDDVNIQTAKTHEELYETVTFETGTQHMDGNTTLKYIRSRKSANLDQGTDIARAQRQQQVISAVFEKLLSSSTIRNTTILSDLYLLYDETFEAQFPKLEALSTANYLLPYKDQIEFTSHTLSIYPEDPNGVITNPPVSKYSGQWVYEIRNLESFKTEINELLQSTQN